MAEGKDYCERKINLLKSNYDELVEVCKIMCDHFFSFYPYSYDCQPFDMLLERLHLILV